MPHNEVEPSDDFTLTQLIREHLLRILDKSGKIKQLKDKVIKVLNEDEQPEKDTDNEELKASLEDVVDKNGVVDRANS